MQHEKVTLVVCDGMGISPDITGNAFVQASTPTFDYLFHNYPSMRLLAAGTEVGLDMGEPGNSEVGHLTIGTGQVLPQSFQIINGAIKSESYKTNKAFLTALSAVKRSPEATLHFVGIISGGGVHGHIDHMLSLLDLAKEKGVERVAIHAITDGRDTPPQVALVDGQRLTQSLQSFSRGLIACVGGRKWAMDRDHNWDRTDRFYWAMQGKAERTAPSFESAIQAGYDGGETDETLSPTVIVDAAGQPVAPIRRGDVVIITNYRPDRIRQLTTRLIMTPLPLNIIAMTDYFLGDNPPAGDAATKVFTAYPLPRPDETLASVLAGAGKSQLHIAETEKYAHITYFFNGHEETKQTNEEWLLVPSAKVDSFDTVPQMSAEAISASYLNAMAQHPADFTTLNYANMDMVGHTGNYDASVLAVEYVDAQLKRIVDWCESKNEWLLITADHGNVEQMVNPVTGEIDKEHTTNPVPFILVHPKLKKERGMDKRQLAVLAYTGILADVAPTILDIFGIQKPSRMVGSSLLSQLSQV